MRSPVRVTAALALLATAGPAAAAPAPPPPLASPAYLLLEPRQGTVLAQRGADEPRPMASTTKLMTALLALERARPDDVVTVPPEAVSVGESSAGLVAGERIAVRDLVTGLLVGSGNDAAIALAVNVAGSQDAFVTLMNDRARALGMTRTRFRNPHGLDAPGHYSTPRDLVRLGRAAYRHPLVREAVARRTATIPGPGGRGTRPLESENTLLSVMPEADGIKTGHTAGAGYALVAHARRAATGVDLYAALIGAPSEGQRAADAKRLLEWGLAQYARPTLLPAGRALAVVAVRDRPGVRLALTVPRALRAPMRLGAPLRQVVVAPTEVVGPVRRGQRVGEIVVRQGPTVLGRRPLVAARDVAGPGLGDRIRSGWDNLL